MPPFRMPFGRKTNNANGTIVDENRLPQQYTPTSTNQLPPKSPSTTVVSEARRPSAININIKAKKDEPEEFKLGIVNDSGVYLPPSPTEKKSMWKRTPTSTTTSSHRSMLSDNDGFSISRESFESYRRSFDISARSPVIHPESSSSTTYSRQSLDSARTPNTPRSIRQHSNRSFELPRPPKTVEEEREEVTENGDVFEDVGLDDNAKQPATKKGLFSRFMNGDGTHSNTAQRPGSGHGNSRFHLPGRRRGQSGQGAELGDMPRPMAAPVNAGAGTTATATTAASMEEGMKQETPVETK